MRKPHPVRITVYDAMIRWKMDSCLSFGVWNCDTIPIFWSLSWYKLSHRNLWRFLMGFCPTKRNGVSMMTMIFRFYWMIWYGILLSYFSDANNHANNVLIHVLMIHDMYFTGLENERSHLPITVVVIDSWINKLIPWQDCWFWHVLTIHVPSPKVGKLISQNH